MTIITRKLTLAEYLSYQDGSDTRFELVEGDLVPMSLGTGKHGAITKFLERRFDDAIEQMKRPWTAQKFAVGVRSPRGGRWETCRIPDVTVLSLEQWQALSDQSAIIELTDSPPFLVVEVVSESTKTTDYRSKRSEYAVLEIPEYWIVDPLEQKITLCLLKEGFYDATVYQNHDLIVSVTFPHLRLTSEEILNQ